MILAHAAQATAHAAQAASYIAHAAQAIAYAEIRPCVFQKNTTVQVQNTTVRFLECDRAVSGIRLGMIVAGMSRDVMRCHENVVECRENVAGRSRDVVGCRTRDVAQMSQKCRGSVPGCRRMSRGRYLKVSVPCHYSTSTKLPSGPRRSCVLEGCSMQSTLISA